MRRLIIGLFISIIIPTIAFAQDLRSETKGGWTESGVVPTCIGGSTCPERRLRVALEDRPVLAVRFHAHDQIGTKADGRLRVKIDGNTVRDYIDIPRKGEMFSIEVDELRGRYLVFEATTNDEVEISEVAVLYGSDRGHRPRDPWDRDRDRRGGEGWRSYPESSACIGGDECGRNGNRITIALDDRRPVLGVRFYAHDEIGTKANGRLSVRIDEQAIDSYIDVQRAGRRHDLDVKSVYGSRLVIRATTDDEVEVKDIEVLYGRGSRGGPGNRGETSHEGGCIGGRECGGMRARIRIPIFGRPVESIRFYARDDIGTRAGGELRIRIDDEILEDALDITREGRTFTIDGKNIAGDYVILEPAEDDEVDVKDVRVKFGDDE